MTPGVGIALLAQSIGLCHAVYREEHVEAALLGASMVTTYLATRRSERVSREAARTASRVTTLEGLIRELRGSA